MRVSVIGLGKTGLPIAVALLKRGHSVIGIEKSKFRLNQLLDPAWDGEEPGCGVEARRGILFRSLPSEEDLLVSSKETDLAILMVNTPELTGGQVGEMDLGPIKEAAWALGQELEGRPYTLVVSSTVMPGTCRDVIQSLVGVNCKVIFNPVWLALGSVVRDYLNPPVVVLGSDQGLSTTELNFFNVLFRRVPLTTDTVTAEALKLVYNEWCTLKMTFTSRTAQIFSNIGADPKTIEPFFKQGGEQPGRFLKPGPPFGGPCFPRDVRFADALAILGHFKDETLVTSIQEINTFGYALILDQIASELPPTSTTVPTIGIAGLTYKVGVPVLEESSSLALITQIIAEGWNVTVYDPLYSSARNLRLSNSLELNLVDSLEALELVSDVIVEMHQHLVPESENRIPVIRPWV